MGERAGYRVKKRNEVSHLLRKQWMMEPYEAVRGMWKTLGGNPGSGSQALRSDLDIGRGFAALVSATYHAPFDSIESSTNCDISDHGLFEVDITQWDKWFIFNYSIDWNNGNLGKSKLIAVMDKDGYRKATKEDKEEYKQLMSKIVAEEL